MCLPALEPQQNRRHQPDYATAQEQRQAEQQPQCDRPADHFSEISGDGNDLGLHEKHVSAGITHPLPQDLRQGFPCDNTKLRALILDEYAHQIRHNQHPNQQIAVSGSRRDIRRDIARINIGDRGDERWAENRSERMPVMMRRRTASPSSRACVDAYLRCGTRARLVNGTIRMFLLIFRLAHAKPSLMSRRQCVVSSRGGRPDTMPLVL